MRITVDEIQSRVAAIVDQDEDTSAVSSTDYSLRLKYINKALHEWSEIADWQTLYKEYNVLVSTSTGNASVALPSDFRKLASFPMITHDGATTDQFIEVLPQEDGRYHENDKRVWLMGNPYEGYILRVLGASLISGASIKVPYYASCQSLASPANVTEIPNADYLVERTIALLWEAREDARFPQKKAEAERILQNMLERENTYNYASDYDHIRTVDEKHNFTIGLD